MQGHKLGQRTWEGGSAESRVKKGTRIPAYAGPPVSWVVLKVMLLHEVHEWEACMTCSNTRPCSLSQYQVSPPWCSGPCNRAEVKISVSWSWRRCSTLKLCSATADWSGDAGGCASGALYETIVRNAVHVKILLSQVVLHMLTETCSLPREQADKPNVLPSQHPVGVGGGCIDAGQVRDSSWILHGWLKSLHLSWCSHGGEEILYLVLQFWHLAVR